MEGGNDLRICPPPVDAIEAGLRSLIDRAHAAHLAVLLGTYPPHVSRYDESVATGEAMREQLNRWIREQGAKHVVEGVVDFDAALRDPASPDRQRAGSGSADGIHPGPPGYQIMADLVPLKALVTASH